ncbi:kinase-like domain-containing protein [Hyaloraphidium curvatum]|nr:kinase-like domain-containing protein [Hyaloraphidium curvatum]
MKKPLGIGRATEESARQPTKDDAAYWRKELAGKTELIVIEQSLGDSGARALAEALKGNSALRTLFLASNSIGDGGARALADVLKGNSALSTLNLGSNSIGVEGARVLAEALKGNSALSTLYLHHNSVGVEGARVLAEALRGNTTLTTLGLYHNSIGVEGARALAEALVHNLTLSDLDIRENGLPENLLSEIETAARNPAGRRQQMRKRQDAEAAERARARQQQEEERRRQTALRERNRLEEEALRQRQQQEVKRQQRLTDEAARVREQEAEVARRLQELRLREEEVEPRLAEAAEMAKRAPAAPAASSWSSSQVTKLPSDPSRSHASPGSTKSDHSAFLSKLRIAKDEVAYSTEKASILGQGSFGTVYRGVLRGATRVAVKTVKGDVTPETVQMFLKEIAVWDGLNQRNVLPLLAFCESPPLLISELTDGSMRARLEQLRWDQTVGLRYLRGTAAGMAYLHSYKVLHGDLKCANIMIDHDIPKIADFGLAKVRTHLSLGTTSGDRDAGGSASGTPPFMAPELWRGGKLRPPVDVYAFAMVCYEVVDEGGYPFQGLGALLLREAVKQGDRPERPDDVDDRMWNLMERMWAQNPADRPTFVEVCAEMEAW